MLHSSGHPKCLATKCLLPQTFLGAPGIATRSILLPRSGSPRLKHLLVVFLHVPQAVQNDEPQQVVGPRGDGHRRSQQGEILIFTQQPAFTFPFVSLEERNGIGEEEFGWYGICVFICTVTLLSFPLKDVISV